MSISRIINKTPLNNEISNIYTVDDIPINLIKDIVRSRFISEGVYVFEQFSMPDYSEKYIISPSFDKLPLTCTEKEWEFDHKEVLVYQLELSKPFFMPLDTNEFSNLLESVQKINHVSVFTQILLCKRRDNWREIAITQYDDFMKGNEYFIDSKFIRKIQNKALNVVSKIGNFTFNRDPIDEIDQKILMENYRFECRFVLFEEKYSDHFIKEINKILANTRLFNELKIVKPINKKNILEDIKNRAFQANYVNQLLSEKEIYCILCNKTPINTEFIKKSKSNTVTSIPKAIKKNHFLQSAISIMPTKQRENEQINSEILEQLRFAFKRVKITDKELKIIDVLQGSTLIKVQMEIPQNVNYQNIQKNLKNIQASVGNENISIEIGDKPDTINILLPRINRDTVYLRSVLESEEFQKYSNGAELPFILGENTNGEFLFGCLAELKHLLISGATGSGKSVFLNILLVCLLLSVPPEMMSLYLVDPKEVEFSNYDGFPQVNEIITSPQEAVALVSSLCREMDNRYKILARAKVRNIQQYNNKNEERMPYIVCVIDEYADLMMTDEGVEKHIVRLSQKARACGIHLVLATQKPISDIVTSVLKSNLPSTISFRLKTNTDYITVFGKGIPYNLLGKGDGVARLEGQHKEYERFQTPIITLDEDEEESIYEKLKDLFEGIDGNHSKTEEKTEEEESNLDKLKRIIANTQETRISELQKQMKIRINLVSELVQELVDEGWLDKQGRSYEIIASEEELEKWRDNIVEF